MESLERQLQISLAILLGLMLLVLFITVNLSSRNILEEFVSQRLSHDAKSLQENLFIESGQLEVRWKRLNSIYNTPYSGHYYAAKFKHQTDANILRSISLQGGNLFLPSVNKPSTSHKILGPKGQHLVVRTDQITLNQQEIIISIAEDMSVLKEKRHEFKLLFVIMGAIGFTFILVLQRIIIHRLFKSLESSRKEMQAIISGELQQLTEDVPTEIYPLVKEFNHSLQLMQQRLERSRHSLGNLAHALKTPLCILTQQLDGAKIDKKNKKRISQAKTQAERIQQLTDRELKRARMAGLGNTAQRFDPYEELPVLISVLKQAHNKQQLSVKLQIEANINNFGDREDMLELLGNLMDNAYKWAKSEIECSIWHDKKTEQITLLIEDDGETKAPLEQLAARGVRLDESIEGHGLGLAICKDIVKLYAGTISFSHSEKLGGFRVEIKLPLA